jgi:preprotein translocase subunit YajC
MLYALILFAEDAPKDVGAVNQFSPIIPFILMFALFFFLIVLPGQRRERKAREELMSKLKKNDEVVTSSGIIGVVINIKDDGEVTLKSDESRIRVLRSSIARILTKDAPKEG